MAQNIAALEQAKIGNVRKMGGLTDGFHPLEYDDSITCDLLAVVPVLLPTAPPAVSFAVNFSLTPIVNVN